MSSRRSTVFDHSAWLSRITRAFRAILRHYHDCRMGIVKSYLHSNAHRLAYECLPRFNDLLFSAKVIRRNFSRNYAPNGFVYKQFGDWSSMFVFLHFCSVHVKMHPSLGLYWSCDRCARPCSWGSLLNCQSRVQKPDRHGQTRGTIRKESVDTKPPRRLVNVH